MIHEEEIDVVSFIHNPSRRRRSLLAKASITLYRGSIRVNEIQIVRLPSGRVSVQYPSRSVDRYCDDCHFNRNHVSANYCSNCGSQLAPFEAARLMKTGKPRKYHSVLLPTSNEDRMALDRVILKAWCCSRNISVPDTSYAVP